MRQRVALVATLARLCVGVVLIDRECECRGHRRRIVGVVYRLAANDLAFVQLASIRLWLRVDESAS